MVKRMTMMVTAALVVIVNKDVSNCQLPSLGGASILVCVPFLGVVCLSFCV